MQSARSRTLLDADQQSVRVIGLTQVVDQLAHEHVQLLLRPLLVGEEDGQQPCLSLQLSPRVRGVGQPVGRSGSIGDFSRRSRLRFSSLPAFCRNALYCAFVLNAFPFIAYGDKM